MKKAFYDRNKFNENPLNTDACIYSPDIVICKTDTDFPVRLPEHRFCKTDVISCAAPNLRNMLKKPSLMELFDLHEKRARHILHIAASKDIDILVLGAFGCGAFSNDPELVAAAWKNALVDYRQYFEIIEFSIFCRDWEKENFKIFNKIIGEYFKEK